MPGHSHIDFGYPWWLAYGHLAIGAVIAAVLLIGYFRKWSWRWLAGPSLLLVWSLAAFLVTQIAMNVNGRAALPMESFLRSGAGRVLDMGAGTGRSALMVLESRPQATLVALDLFGKSYEMHFGTAQTPERRLMTNLRAAGVDARATIVKGDMRQLPFEAASFDAIVSSFAIDHLSRDGSVQAIREGARVLKPGGEFMMTVFAKDAWIQFTFGPLLLHAASRGNGWWVERVKEAGFKVLEQRTTPGMFHILARRE